MVVVINIVYLISSDYLAPPTRQAFMVMIPTSFIYLPASVVSLRLKMFSRKGEFRQRKLTENSRVVELSATMESGKLKRKSQNLSNSAW